MLKKKLSLDPILDAKDITTLFDNADKLSRMELSMKFVMEDIGITSRVYNHWVKMGIVTRKINFSGGHKYHFSFTELIWMNIIQELRKYDFPLPKIKKLYLGLMWTIDLYDMLKEIPIEDRNEIIEAIPDIPIGDNIEDKDALIADISEKFSIADNNPENEHLYTTLLELIIGSILMYRSDVRILIDYNGNCLPYSERDVQLNGFEALFEDSCIDKHSYICISMMKFLQKFISSNKHIPFLTESQILNDNELYILSLIREGKAKSITINFAGDKPSMIEVKKDVKTFAETRLTEILLKRGYQEINIKTQDGNIAVSCVTTKKKLK
jgi:DNA-binding transcriptional MerR regulator